MCKIQNAHCPAIQRQINAPLPALFSLTKEVTSTQKPGPILWHNSAQQKRDCVGLFHFSSQDREDAAGEEATAFLNSHTQGSL